MPRIRTTQPEIGQPATWQQTVVERIRAGKLVLRGGSFGSVADLVRCAGRHSYSPDFTSNNGGFRVVVSPGS